MSGSESATPLELAVRREERRSAAIFGFGDFILLILMSYLLSTLLPFCVLCCLQSERPAAMASEVLTVILPSIHNKPPKGAKFVPQIHIHNGQKGWKGT